MAVTFRTKNRSLCTAAAEMLAAERPMTLRQLFYRMVSAGELDNSQKEYKRLGCVMTRLREAGDVPRTWLVDHTRATLKPSSWSGLPDFADSVRACYRKDFWASLAHHVEVFVEKDAVAGTIEPVTDEFDIRIHVCRGYASISFAGEIADVWREVRKPIFAYYLGDFDPSGFDLERDLREKLDRYSNRPIIVNPSLASPWTVVWQRLGVTAQDFGNFNLIRLPVKNSDLRAERFKLRHGDDCAEIDAIPPTELRDRVRTAIEGHIDRDEWNRLGAVEAAEKETLNRMVKKLGRAG